MANLGGVAETLLDYLIKTMSLNDSSPSLMIEEEKQDVNRGFGFHSPIYRKTRTGAGKALSM
jgi:hypothetical protein